LFVKEKLDGDHGQMFDCDMGNIMQVYI